MVVRQWNFKDEISNWFSNRIMIEDSNNFTASTKWVSDSPWYAVTKQLFTLSPLIFWTLYIYSRQDFGRQSTNSSSSNKTLQWKEYKECGVGLAISESNVELKKRKQAL